MNRKAFGLALLLCACLSGASGVSASLKRLSGPSDACVWERIADERDKQVHRTSPWFGHSDPPQNDGQRHQHQGSVA